MRDKITELIKNSNHECCMYPDKLADKILEVVEKEYYLIPKEITVPAIRLIQEELIQLNEQKKGG